MFETDIRTELFTYCAIDEDTVGGHLFCRDLRLAAPSDNHAIALQVIKRCCMSSVEHCQKIKPGNGNNEESGDGDLSNVMTPKRNICLVPRMNCGPNIANISTRTYCTC